MKIRKNNRGFTLVELLLVMAIIGILAGVIFVATAPARKKARITTFKQNMKDLATAGSLCIDSEGTITGGTANGEATAPIFCSAVSSDRLPEIKQCRGGGAPVTIGVTNETDDDYVITADCSVTGDGTGASDIVCHASCTVNGCKFSNGDITSTNDGCPQT